MSLTGWAVGIQSQPDSPVIMVHCQNAKKISQPSELVSWIDVAHPTGLPMPPVLGASTMGRTTQGSLYIAIVPPEGGGASCPVVLRRSLTGHYWYPCQVNRRDR